VDEDNNIMAMDLASRLPEYTPEALRNLTGEDFMVLSRSIESERARRQEIRMAKAGMSEQLAALRRAAGNMLREWQETMSVYPDAADWLENYEKAFPLSFDEWCLELGEVSVREGDE
jgi:hypothetical protein